MLGARIAAYQAASGSMLFAGALLSAAGSDGSRPCPRGFILRRMPVTSRDRRHFERIAAAKRDEQEERMREAAREPAMKRIIEGLELGYAAPVSAESDALLEERARGQGQLAARARRLGLLR